MIAFNQAKNDNDFLDHITSNSQGWTAKYQFYPPARKQQELCAVICCRHLHTL